ncbi:MAG: oxygen-independent coproporphyrinogen III oxidase [Flavobacteriaceae bacterium]|nr:oxygen-independent coproporphyrinogen III oxidase [Flavobacteriaceae bacterium]
MSTNLIQKYNVAGPRYTSYPTVPYWDVDAFSREAWEQTCLRGFQESNKQEGISIYIHLPFCESLCTFCGCHKRITKQHKVETPYIDAILKEWKLYVDLFGERPIIKELHLGGGTPTFFSPENLKKMLEGIYAPSELHTDKEFSFEGHPNNTTKEHLQTLYDLGFTRVSFGVQDYSPNVQKAINRIQAFENVERVTKWSREIGYESISHDLVFGLPHQTQKDVEYTIDKTRELQPDRLAFYSYAHVPWIKGNGQRGFSEADLPNPDEKRAMYEFGKKHLSQVGYEEIGMDHFALEHDSMYISMQKRNLHRNFMGYTASKTQVMVGLGVSSISDSWWSFAQNTKNFQEYYDLLEKEKIPVVKGHILSPEDLVVRKHILDLMCHLQTDRSSLMGKEQIIDRLGEFVQDGLLEITPKQIVVTEAGRPFVRNICMAFDLLLQRNKPDTQLFSMTI